MHQPSFSEEHVQQPRLIGGLTKLEYDRQRREEVDPITPCQAPGCGKERRQSSLLEKVVDGKKLLVCNKCFKLPERDLRKFQ